MKRLCACILLLCLALCGAAHAREETPKPALEIQRSVSNEFVGHSDSASLLYRVENTGNVPLQDVGLTDPICGRLLSIALLAPGAYETVQVQIAVTQECQSTPQAIWYYDGMRYERTLEPVVLTPALNRLRASLSIDRAEALPGETVTLTVELTNEGNTELYDVRLSDAQHGELGVIKETIAPGASLQRSYGVLVTAPGSFCVTALAHTQSDETTTATSNEVAISLLQDDGRRQLEISAAPAPQDASAGGACALVTLVNGGKTPLTNVTIAEQSLGTLRTLASLAPGETQLLLQCEIDRPQELLFLAQFAAQEDSRTTVLAEPILLEPGAAGEEEVFLQGSPVQLGNSAYAVFMYAGFWVLALLAGLLLLRGALRRRRRRIAREKRARRMQILRKNAKMSEEEWVQTRPHKPVAPQNEEKDP